MSNENLSYVGVGRIRDKSILASIFDRIPTQEKTQIESLVQKCLTDASTKTTPGSRERRQLGDGSLFILCDTQLCCLYFLAAKNKKYSERHAFALLGEVVRIVGTSGEDTTVQAGELTRTIKKPVKELIDKYDTPQKFDKTAQVQTKVDNTKEVMEDNLKKILDSHAHIRTLQDKTDNLASSASQFSRSAGDLRRIMYWRKIRVNIILGIVLAAVLSYIIVIIVRLSRGKDAT